MIMIHGIKIGSLCIGNVPAESAFFKNGQKRPIFRKILLDQKKFCLLYTSDAADE